MRGAATVGVAVFAVAAGVALSLSWRRQTDWSRVQHTLATRAGRDPLTGLPDRVALTERLSAGLGSTRTPTASRPAVLFCDLDRFRRINETYGHACGDNVLVAAGLRFANALRAGDTIGRLDGDKFVVICPVVSTSEAAEIANRLLATLENPFAVGGHTVRVHREHRRRGRRRLDRRSRRSPARRGPCDGAGQARRPRASGRLLVIHAAAHVDRRHRAAARRARRRAVQARLPTGRVELRRLDRRARGVDPLGSSRPRTRVARRLHPAAGGVRAHRRRGHVGAARGVPPGRGVDERVPRARHARSR